MTLTEMAFTPWFNSPSITCFCSDGSPTLGFLNSSSTPVSPAALTQPDSTIDQNGSGLLVTKATFGPVGATATGVLAVLQAGRSRTGSSHWESRFIGPGSRGCVRRQ